MNITKEIQKAQKIYNAYFDELSAISFDYNFFGDIDDIENLDFLLYEGLGFPDNTDGTARIHQEGHRPACPTGTGL